MADPLISVVMPVHNALPFLQSSIESILNQTFTDFEFVILNDGSTDGSERVLRAWELKDSRIRLYESKIRTGLVCSSNFVVGKARAPLIARMDADDLCEPERLQREWEVMRDNADVAVVGSLCDGIDATGRRIRDRDRWRIVRHSVFPPFPHGSVMFRRQIFEAVGGYRNEFERYEDLDLFRRIAERARVVTLPETLYHFRYHSQNISGMTAEENGKSQHNHAANLSELYFLGAMRLWSGHAPGILREVWEAKSSGWSMREMLITGWAAWADLHPRSLKSLARAVVTIRDLLASTRVSDGRFYEWRFK